MNYKIGTEMCLENIFMKFHKNYCKRNKRLIKFLKIKTLKIIEKKLKI